MNTKKMKKKLNMLIALTGLLALTLTTPMGLAAYSYGEEGYPQPEPTSVGEVLGVVEDVAIDEAQTGGVGNADSGTESCCPFDESEGTEPSDVTLQNGEIIEIETLESSLSGTLEGLAWGLRMRFEEDGDLIPIAGGIMFITCVDTGVVIYSTPSNSDGRVYFPEVPVGTYIREWILPESLGVPPCLPRPLKIFVAEEGATTYYNSTISMFFWTSIPYPQICTCVDPTFDVNYEFVSSTGEPLPEAVLALLPERRTGYPDGETVSPTTVTQTTVSVPGGTWTFEPGWDPETLTIDGDDVTFVGSWTFTPDPVLKMPTTTLRVDKVWNDNNNSAGIRPDSIQVQLRANGVNQGPPIQLNASNQWSHTFTELPVHDSAERVIVYDAIEINVPEGYRVSYLRQGNVITITNTHCSCTGCQCCGCDCNEEDQPRGGGRRGQTGTAPKTGDITSVAPFISGILFSMSVLLGGSSLKRRLKRD